MDDCPLGVQPALIRNNYDWFRDVKLLDFLRDYGKLFRVQQMLNKHSVRSRLSVEGEGAGISFTEFSYQLLQAYDFYHLHKHEDCTLQIGGSDQWGNITAGTQLIHRLLQPDTLVKEGVEETTTSTVFGLTLPLITTSDGKKLGKSSSAPGAGIWLDPTRSSPYELYQYLINLPDDDTARFLPLFTFLPLETISGILAQHHAAPHHRIAQKTLAKQVTELLHGKDEAEKAQAVTATFFERGADPQMTFSLDALPSTTPQITMDRDEVVTHRLMRVLEATQLFQTNSERFRLSVSFTNASQRKPNGPLLRRGSF